MLFHNIRFIFGFLPLMMICYYGAKFLTKKWNKNCMAENMVLLFFSVFFLWIIGKEFLPVLGIFYLMDYGTGWLLGAKWVKKSGFGKIVLIFVIMLHIVLFALCVRYRAIGVPFYTLNAVSYLMDVYRGRVETQKNPLLFAVYLSMFPLMLAGPVVRYCDMEPQLAVRRATIDDISEGTCRFGIGWLKTALIGLELLEIFREIVSMGVENLPVVTAFFGIFVLLLLSYYLFSGYWDMAIGMGKMMGFSYPENFFKSYTALSVTDFWRRWHLSLSLWFKDYVYISIGGNHCDRNIQARNVMITWLLVGIWHGFNINSLLFGIFFGVIVVTEMYYTKLSLKFKIPRRFYTLSCVAVGWMIIAFDTPQTLFSYMKALVGMNHAGIGNDTSIYLIYSSLTLIFIALIGLTGVPSRILQYFLKKKRKDVLALGYWCVAFIICVASFFMSDDILEENASVNKYFCKITSYWDYLTNRQETQDIYFGADGFLFRSHKYYEVDDSLYGKNLEALKQAMGLFGEDEDVQSNYCILIPSARTIVEDNVPVFAPEWDEEQLEDQAATLLGEQYLSTVDILRRRNDEYLYYRTEEGVTTLGGFYIYKLWAEKLGFTPLSADEDTLIAVNEKYYGSLARTLRIYPKADTLYRYSYAEPLDVKVYYSGGRKRESLFETGYLKTKKDMNYFLSGAQDIVRITTSAETGRKLLVLTDDTARRLVQFFVPHFDELTIVNIDLYEDDLENLKEELPDDVLFLFDMSSLYEEEFLYRKTGQKVVDNFEEK